MKKTYKKALFYGAMFVLFLYTFRHVNQGIDVTDTGYHFSNFKYMSEMDPMWIFSTYLASVLGHLFTCLPGGDTLLGIGIYTTMIPAILGVVTFLFFTKVVRTTAWAAFLGVLLSLSLCWCPATCLYNYLTYLLFTVGAMLLYMGLTKEEKKYLVLAGICLGANVLVRFPNLAEAALILAVWFTCFIKKEAVSEYFKKTGYCLLGYLLGIGAVLLQICVQYGLGEYVNGIIRLLGMTSDAQDYTLYSMVFNLINAYLMQAKWMLILIACVGLGILGFSVFPKKCIKIKMTGYTICCVILMRWFYGQGVFRTEYEAYDAVLYWNVLLLMAALILACILVCYPKAEAKDKILSAIVIIYIGIIPLGSNNNVYANLNCMFLVLPYLLHHLYRLARLQQEKLLRVKYPLLIMSCVCMLLFTWQSLNFGNRFVFRDQTPRNTEVTSIDALYGMKTNPDNAAALQELGAYAQAAELKGKKVLLFGDLPALSAYLEMPFVLSPWPDLASYSNVTFETELAVVLEQIDTDRPVIILGSDFNDFLTYKMEDADKQKQYETRYGLKMGLIADMIETYGYQNTFCNDKFVVYE